MRATLRLPRTATYADYLAVEQHSEHRHELIDGVIAAMAGGSDEPNAIAGRLAMLLGVRLDGACRYYTPDQLLLDRFTGPQPLRGWLDHLRQARPSTARSAGDDQSSRRDRSLVAELRGRRRRRQHCGPVGQRVSRHDAQKMG
jgi:Uma2 family endonuclease